MKKVWFKKNSLLLYTVKREVKENYPFLRVIVSDKNVFIQGTYELILEGIVVECFKILVILPDNFPRELPRLFEIGGRFPITAKRHFFLNGKACLFIEEERFKYWPSSSIKDFIDGPIRNFFISQLYFEKKSKWPFGAREHDEVGIMQFYLEYLDIHNYRVLLKFLEYFSSGKIKESHLCPCGSGNKIRNCVHKEGILFLRDKVSRSTFKSSLKSLKLIAGLNKSNFYSQNHHINATRDYCT